MTTVLITSIGSISATGVALCLAEVRGEVRIVATNSVAEAAGNFLADRTVIVPPTASGEAARTARPPWSPATRISSGKKRRPHKTGLPRRPSETGTTMWRPAPGSKAAARRFTRSGEMRGMSASSTTAASAASPSAASPAFSEVDRPSAKSGLWANRRSSPASAPRTASD